MTEEAELQRIVKGELGNRGYVVNVTAHREGEVVVGKVAVLSAETDEPVARIVGAGNVDDLRLCFGVDAQGTVRDIVVKMLGAWEGMQGAVPSFLIRTKS